MQISTCCCTCPGNILPHSAVSQVQLKLCSLTAPNSSQLLFKILLNIIAHEKSSHNYNLPIVFPLKQVFNCINFVTGVNGRKRRILLQLKIPKINYLNIINYYIIIQLLKHQFAFVYYHPAKGEYI